MQQLKVSIIATNHEYWSSQHKSWKSATYKLVAITSEIQ